MPVFWTLAPNDLSFRCSVLQKHWRTLNNYISVMRRINNCAHEYSKIPFISFQLQKPLENIATACTICYAAATFSLKIPVGPLCLQSSPPLSEGCCGTYFVNLMTRSKVCQCCHFKLSGRKSLSVWAKSSAIKTFRQTFAKGRQPKGCRFGHCALCMWPHFIAYFNSNLFLCMHVFGCMHVKKKGGLFPHYKLLFIWTDYEDWDVIIF